MGVVGPIVETWQSLARVRNLCFNRRVMERTPEERDRRVGEKARTRELVPEYGGARGTPSESGRTIFQG